MTVTSEFFMPPPAGARDAVTDDHVRRLVTLGDSLPKSENWDDYRLALMAAIESLTGKADARDDIHTCNYYCTRPACIRAQRDELVAAMEATRPAESVAQGGDSDWERQWREGWAYSYSGWKLYGDDGELQDNSVQPFIDWRKDSPGEIRSKIAQRSKRAREESEAATPTPTPATGSGGEESK